LALTTGTKKFYVVDASKVEIHESDGIDECLKFVREQHGKAKVYRRKDDALLATRGEWVSEPEPEPEGEEGTEDEETETEDEETEEE